jgi:CubicO group peptidase (beta-lactamase class C family)
VPPRRPKPLLAPSRVAHSGLVAAAGLIAAAGLASTARAAPDEAAHGAEQGYPIGDRSNWFRQPHLVGAFSAMDQLFPVRNVKAGGAVRPLPRHPAATDWAFAAQVRAYLDQHPASGLLILKDGELLAEHYQYGRTASQRFTSFSMAKTVVAMAVGLAVAEGHIASVDEPVDKLEPALARTAWKGVTLREVLTMSSGVRFDETYDSAGSDIARLSRAWTQQRGSLLQGLQGFTERDAEPGERFRYVSADTQVLTQVLQRATGRALSDYVGEKLWAPMGAEADAAWVLDGGGTEAGYCCLSARLRDWGRLGLLLADGGRHNGRELLPAAWVQAATSVRPQDGHLRPGRATSYFGYGYQTWLFPGQLGFALLGVRGQSVFVHPGLKLVMVQTGVWPRSVDIGLSRARNRFWSELVEAAAAMR